MKKSEVIAILNNTENDSAEKAKAIMELHGATVEFHKSQKEELKTEIGELQAKLKAAPKPDADGKDWKTEYDELKSKYDTDLAAKDKELSDFKAGVEAKEKTSVKIAALESALLAAGANAKYVKKIIKDVDVDKLKMDGETIKDVDKVIEGVKGDWGDLFGKVEEKPADVADPPANGGGKTYTIEQIQKMSPDEINANWGAVESALSNQTIQT